MNDSISIITLILVGICIASAVFHAFAAFSKPFSRTHFYFFLTLCGITLFELFHLFAFKSENQESYIFNLRFEIFAIIGFVIFLNWFVREYCQIKPKVFEVGISVLLSFGLVVNLLQSNTLQYTSITSIKTVDVLGGEKLTFASGDISDIFCGMAILMFVSFINIIARLYQHYNKTKSKTSFIMMLSTLLLIATGFQGIMVRVGAMDGIHFGPFGVMAMVITMSIAMIRELILALRESEFRYRSLVEQSPFSIQLLQPNGFTTQINHAWEKLWGSKGENLKFLDLREERIVKENGLLPYMDKGFSGVATEIPATKFTLPLTENANTSPKEKWIRGYIYPIKDENGQLQEIVLQHEDISDKKRLEDAFRAAASVFTLDFEIGYFEKLTSSISNLMDVEYVMIARQDPSNAKRLKSLAFSNKETILDNVEFSIEDSPLYNIYSSGKLLLNFNPGSIIPHPFLCCFNIRSLLAVALVDAESKPLGMLLLFDSRQFIHIDSLQAVADIYAVRAATEIERNNAYEIMQLQKQHLQNLVEQRTEELTVANKELEAFSYSVSHDLRAPLRSIAGFAAILTEDFKNIFTKDSINYMNRIKENANYMSNLIDNLLQLSRVSRFNINRTQVNLSNLLLESVRKQQEIDPRDDAEINIESDIYVNGDRNLLSIAVDNLVSNAWKYTAKTQRTLIECGQTEINGFPVYFIRDNGAGFDMKYSHKLFTAFNRLHSNDEFQGTGVGLATVARIIARHNGKIWAEAKPERGASFYFTLQNTVSNLTSAAL